MFCEKVRLCLELNITKLYCQLLQLLSQMVQKPSVDSMLTLSRKYFYDIILNKIGWRSIEGIIPVHRPEQSQMYYKSLKY